SISRFSLAGGQPVDLISNYMGTRFNSPNDLTFGTDGTLYFTDPNYQAPMPAPQPAELAYRVPPGSNTATPIGSGISRPNGITFGAADHKALYLTALGNGTSGGVFKVASQIPGMPF